MIGSVAVIFSCIFHGPDLGGMEDEIFEFRNYDSFETIWEGSDDVEPRDAAKP